MTTKQTDKKDYIDEHEEWQRHQFDPGHFTDGHLPGWMKHPGKRKRLGVVFLVIGLFYMAWGIYDILKTDQIVSAIFLSFAAIVFLLAGVRFIKKLEKVV
ncbi:MAG: hypothetical protein WCT46_00635 [Candidatus Gracilibacteria bacterium]|jgi:hypothetical protein